MTDDLYYRKLESMSTTDLVDMIRERDGCIAELEKENAELKDTLGKVETERIQLIARLAFTENALNNCKAKIEKEVYNSYLDKTELEDILEAIKCYFMCDMSVQCVEMQEEEHEREKRIKNLSEKIKFMLSKFEE